MASARDGDDLADHRGVFRYSSLASIAAAVFAPFYSAFGWGFDARFAALVVIAGLTVYRHRVNIRHLIAGTERQNRRQRRYRRKKALVRRLGERPAWMYGKRQVSRLLWTVARSLRVRERRAQSSRRCRYTSQAAGKTASACRNVTLQARSKLRVCAHRPRRRAHSNRFGREHAAL